MIFLSEEIEYPDGVACFARVLSGFQQNLLGGEADDEEDEDAGNFHYYWWADQRAHPYNRDFWEEYGERKPHTMDPARWQPVVDFYCHAFPGCLEEVEPGVLSITAHTTNQVPWVAWALHDIRKISEWPGIARVIVELMDRGLSVEAALSVTYGVITEHEYNWDRLLTLPIITTSRELCHLIDYSWNPGKYYDVLAKVGSHLSGSINGYPSDIKKKKRVTQDVETIRALFPSSIKLHRENSHIAGRAINAIGTNSYYLGTCGEFVDTIVKLHGSNKQ